MQFQVGDIVMINSGNGPHMTVETVNADGSVECLWFNTGGEVQRGPFSAKTLKKV